MRRLVVFVVGVLFAAALVPAAASAQSGDPLNEVALLSLDGCFDPDQFVVSGGYVATGGCFGGPGMQLAREFLTEVQEPFWAFSPVEGVPYGEGIGATRTTFAGVDSSLLDPFAVLSATMPDAVENVDLPLSSAFVYDGGEIAGGRSSTGADRLVVPIASADSATSVIGANFAVFTRQPTGPMGETGWDSELVVAPTDGSIPEPVEFTYEASQVAVLGDTIVVGYETFGDPAVVIADAATGAYASVPNAAPLADVQLFPTQMVADTSMNRVFIGWTELGVGELIRHVTMVDVVAGTSTPVIGMPGFATALTVVRRDDTSSDLFVATGLGEIFSVEVSAAGTATTQLLADTGAEADDLTLTAISGSGDLLAVVERTISITVAPRAQVRVFELGDADSGPASPFDVGVIAPGTDPNTFETGPFDDIKDSIVGVPGLPVTECLVDVNTVDDQAICFVTGARQAYIDALVATDRPPDEVLWIGRTDETPVKP